MILALDNATRGGFCHGEIGGALVFGTQDFGRGRGNGEVLANFHAWLTARLDALPIKTVVFESPYMPVGPGNPWAAPANALTIRRLFAFAGITEAICHARRLRCLEARPSEITRAFLGGPAPRGRDAKKAATVKMCRVLGFNVANDDEGDALALWIYAEATFAPYMLSRRRSAAGLELGLHETRNAPRREPRGAREPSSVFLGNSNDGFSQTKDIAPSGKLQFQDIASGSK